MPYRTGKGGFRLFPTLKQTGECCARRITNLGTAPKDTVLGWCADCKCYYSQGELASGPMHILIEPPRPPKTNTFGQVVE
jgi:hypothetical protein